MTSIEEIDVSHRWEDLAIAVSSVCGWLYFLCWSLSFYPQPLLNLRRRTTQGLTPDFPLLNVLGFSCYSISVLALLYSPSVRSEYAARHPLSPRPTVRFNDVAFGVHAWVLCAVTYSQFWPRLWGWDVGNDGNRQVTKFTLGAVCGSFLSVLIVLITILVLGGKETGGIAWAWLDLIYALQYIKLLLTLFKYTPQVIHNYHRKSTAGWSIAQILLDVSGGVLSLVQLLIDSGLQADWSGLTGNPVKLGLANISVLFDLVFMVQHYVLYGPVEEKVGPGSGQDEETSEERAPLLR